MTKKANQETESRADRLADALKILQDKMELIKEETKTGGLSKYKHLGVAGSPAHVEAVMQMSRRTQLDSLSRSFDSLMDSWSDVYGSNKKAVRPNCPRRADSHAHQERASQ